MIFQEFKKFITRGNVIDIAVAFIVGAAFNKIVSSLVEDIIMPPLGLVLKNVKFKDMKQVIGGTATDPITINYGNFLQMVIEFLLVSFAVFLLVKMINSLRRKEEKAPEAPIPPTEEQKLLMQIRDILQEKKI